MPLIQIDFPNDPSRDSMKCPIEWKPAVGDRFTLNGEVIEVDDVMLHAGNQVGEPAATVTMLGVLGQPETWPQIQDEEG